MMKPYSQTNAEHNLATLANNRYPGRLLIVGFVGEVAVLAYALMGRSEDSQNRRLVREGDTVRTEVVDNSKSVGDTDITLYDAMTSVGGVRVVSNGKQTDTVVSYLNNGGTFEEAVQAMEHEPDAPNFTPRITGFVDGQQFGIAIVRKDPHGDGSIRDVYTYNAQDVERRLGPEIGLCTHTYQGDGRPLETFEGPPFPLPLHRDPEEMAQLLWESLDPDNRVAVVAQTIGPAGVAEFAIINRHEQSKL